MDKLWLPTGHHWDLHILHYRAEDAGTFTGGGHGLLWHTTESPFFRVDSMQDVLDRKRAAPHLLIGGRAGLEHPVVVQMIPFNRAGRALQNDPSDGKQTNRANKIQVEICGYTDHTAAQAAGALKDWIPNWTENRYQALANLAGLTMHRFDISNVAHYDFSNPKRLGDQQFTDADGHLGHCHAPDNTHTDPTRLREGYLVELIDKLPEAGYAL